jgi:hypothetical protein
MFGPFRKLLASKSEKVANVTADLDPQLFVYVKIPGDIQPLARGERFEDPLQVALEAEQLGNISGGGSQLDDPYPDGGVGI